MTEYVGPLVLRGDTIAGEEWDVAPSTTPRSLTLWKKGILYLIVVISNARRFRRRYELYRAFMRRLAETEGICIYTVELAFGDRPFVVTSAQNPHHVQLRSGEELWHKENMINIGVQHLPKDWKYVAWVDADVQFINTNWVDDTLNALQHHPIVQLFQTCVDTGPRGQALHIWKGFAWQYVRGAALDSRGYEFWHPGYAWACTRKAWNSMGGLLDIGILGAGDHHMALAWIGKYERSLPGHISEEYRRRVRNFQDLCETTIRHNLGYVPGTIVHFWHGRKKDRKYIERWDILIKHHFDPLQDIKRDCQGLWAWTGNKPDLERDVRQYFEQRNEDSMDE